MVKMILNMLAMEQDIKQIHHCVDRIAQDFQGFDEDPAVINLRKQLERLQSRQQEAMNQWPQLGAPIL